MSEEVKRYLPYVIAGLVLMIGLAVGLRVLFAALAPQLVGWATTFAWVITSAIGIAWYATRDKES